MVPNNLHNCEMFHNNKLEDEYEMALAHMPLHGYNQNVTTTKNNSETHGESIKWVGYLSILLIYYH